jgi:polyisoprenoid-binding protein YceI
MLACVAALNASGACRPQSGAAAKSAARPNVAQQAFPFLCYEVETMNLKIAGRRTVVAALSVLTWLPLHAAEYTKLDAAASRISFSYRQMQVPMNGHFAKFEGHLRFDPAHPESAQAQIKVALASIDAGSPDATQYAGAKEWLDSAAHPLASFTSSQVKALGGNRFEATGQLLIKGKSQTVRTVFSLTEQGDKAVLEGQLPIQRGHFAIGAGEWADPSIVANEVQIAYRLSAATH